MTTAFQLVDVNELPKLTQVSELPTASNLGSRHGSSSKETWTVAFSPDNSYFAWSCGKGIVKLVPWINKENTFDTAAYNQDRQTDYLRIPHDGNKFSCRGKSVQVIQLNCNSTVWSLSFGSSLSHKKLRKPPIQYVHHNNFDSDDILILAAGLQTGKILTFDVYSGEKIILMDHKESVRHLAFAPNGSLTLVSASRDKTLKVWDMKDDGNMVVTLRGHKHWAMSSAFSPDSSRLVSVGAGGSAFLWDMETFKRIRSLKGHYHDVVACQFSPDGAWLITASWDARVIMWDPSLGTILAEFHHVYPPLDPVLAGGANTGCILDMSFSNHGNHFATICEDGYLRVWSIFDNSDPVAIAEVNEAVRCGFSPNGMVIAVGFRNGSVQFFSLPSSEYNALPLQHLCRMVIRRALPSTQKLISNINFGCLTRYLTYEEMVPPKR